MKPLPRVPSARTDAQVEAARVKAQRKVNAELGFPDKPVPPCAILPDPSRDRARAAHEAAGDYDTGPYERSKRGNKAVAESNKRRKGTKYAKHGDAPVWRPSKEWIKSVKRDIAAAKRASTAVTAASSAATPAPIWRPSEEWIASVKRDIAAVERSCAAVGRRPRVAPEVTRPAPPATPSRVEVALVQMKTVMRYLKDPKKWPGKAPPMAPDLDDLPPAEARKFVKAVKACKHA
jgi:hypothetical protein